MSDCIDIARPASPLAGLIERLRRSAAQARERRLEREGLRKMLELDDHSLRDIGVTRGDIAYAAGLPASEDPSGSLRKLSKRGDRW